MSNTSSLLFSLPVIFVSIGRGGGGGGRCFGWIFLKGQALIHSRKWEGHDFFRKKILKLVRRTSFFFNVKKYRNS